MTHTDPSVTIDKARLFREIEQMRADGTLSQIVTQSDVRYQTSPTHPGLLERITADGRRESGQLISGQFVVTDPSH